MIPTLFAEITDKLSSFYGLCVTNVLIDFWRGIHIEIWRGVFFQYRKMHFVVSFDEPDYKKKKFVKYVWTFVIDYIGFLG